MEQLKKDITLISGIGQLSTTLMGTGLFMIQRLPLALQVTFRFGLGLFYSSLFALSPLPSLN